jgi:glucokinase
MILGGDIGGTKCNLALFEKRGTGLTAIFRRRYPSRDAAKFDDIIDAFLKDAHDVLAQSSAGKVLAAGFGVAGAVIGRRVQATNLAWGLDADALARQLGTPHIVLLNDLEAAGYSMAVLGTEDFCTLNAGTPAPESPRAVIAAGTGLGEAILIWNGSRYVVVPTEGGHCDLAPRTEQEIELLRYLKKTHKYVSFELILAGRGFYTLHDFLGPSVRHATFDQPGTDPAPEITQKGLEGSCPVCVQVLDLFTTLYGAEAGNLALKALARGGVFVAGGIAPKILPKMKSGNFMRAFCEKEKFEELLSRVPVQLVLNQEAPLIGAAAEAARVLGN